MLQLHALSQVNKIKAQIGRKKPAFFFDYDGTLTPIVAKPELATLSPKMHDTLKKLSEQYFVAIISGRGLEDVRTRVGISDLYYAGNHGLEVAGPTYSEAKQEVDKKFLAEIKSAYNQLSQQLKKIKNSMVEDKKYSLSVHYRLVDESKVEEVEACVDKVVSAHPHLIKRLGKKVFELRPKIDWHKGKVVLHLLKKLNLSLDEVEPIYIGDDVTDEDAFNTLKGKGIGILVSEEERDSAASYYLTTPAEAQLFLSNFI